MPLSPINRSLSCLRREAGRCASPSLQLGLRDAEYTTPPKQKLPLSFCQPPPRSPPPLSLLWGSWSRLLKAHHSTCAHLKLLPLLVLQVLLAWGQRRSSEMTRKDRLTSSMGSIILAPCAGLPAGEPRGALWPYMRSTGCSFYSLPSLQLLPSMNSTMLI